MKKSLKEKNFLWRNYKVLLEAQVNLVQREWMLRSMFQNSTSFKFKIVLDSSSK